MCELATADIVIHINSHADFYAVLYTDTDIYSINAIVCGSHAHDILPYQEVNAQRLIVTRDYAFVICNLQGMRHRGIHVSKSMQQSNLCTLPG